jgi:RES domain-containing protein
LTAKALEAFRIVTRKRVADAFSGEGARLYGGRWNPKGIRLVYTAGSRALAILEMLAQDQPLRARYAIIPVIVPSSIRIERLSRATLPKGWEDARQSERLRAIGANWVKRGKSAVLCVPSAVVPSEFNYLLNPAHTDFSRIKQGHVETLRTDRRLLDKVSKAPRRKSRQSRP